jgi:hypothetical protein
VSGLDLGTGDIALLCQLVSAAALGVHLLVLRPRAARRDLVLDARIVQDELELDARLGQVSPTAPETLALQQILRRLQHDPRSAGMVAERITLLSQTGRQRSPQPHAESLRGALDRLEDAGARYLRGAWPRAGMPAPRPATRSYGLEEIEDLDDQDEVKTVDDRGRDGTADVVLDLSEVDHLADDAGEQSGEQWGEQSRPADEADAADEGGTRVAHGGGPSGNADAPEHGADEPTPELHLQIESEIESGIGSPLGSELTVGSGSATEDDSRESVRAGIGSTDLDGTDEPDRPTAWVDLVRAENAGPVAGSGDRHDRHSRPFRPGRSSTRPSDRPAEPVDRPTVLPH